MTVYLLSPKAEPRVGYIVVRNPSSRHSSTADAHRQMANRRPAVMNSFLKAALRKFPSWDQWVLTPSPAASKEEAKLAFHGVILNEGVSSRI